MILAGILGFLPILGFWMIPLGIAVLAVDFPFFHRLLDRMLSWGKGEKRNENEQEMNS